MMEGWKYIKLGEIIHIKHGYGFKGEYFVDEPNNNFLLTPGNFAIGGGFKSDKMKYYEGPINDEFILSAGDVIVTMTDLSKQADTLGYSAKIPSDPENTYLHNQRLGLVSLKTNDFDIDYIYWLLRTQYYQKYIAGSSSGATVKHTSPKKIYSTKLLVPESKETQRKIASILSAYDDLIENNLKRIKLLEEKAQLTYEEWFVRMKFPGHETTPINKETGLPEGWELVKVEALLAKLKSTKKIKSSEILESGSTPVIDQSRDFIKGYTNEPDALIDIDEPIIVFGDHTRILKFIDFNFARGADGTQLVLSKDPRMPQHLFYQVLKGIDLSDYHYARHFKYLKDTEINICDEITANHYEDFAAPLFKAIKQMRDQNKLLKEARDILLPRLMTGMIDVEEMNLETLRPSTA